MGRVDKWLKKEGDVFRSTDPLCEVTVSTDAVFDNYNDVQVAVDAHQSGVLSKILVPNGEIVAVDQPIALFVDDLKEYMELVEASRLATAEAELMEGMYLFYYWSYSNHMINSIIKSLPHHLRLSCSFLHQFTSYRSQS